MTFRSIPAPLLALTLLVFGAGRHSPADGAELYQWTTLAGNTGGGGATDGPVALAHFLYPSGMASDAANNLYVADSGASTIRKITAAGVVSTVAGLARAEGSTDGPAASARFNRCSGVAADKFGNLYVADSNNQTIRKITPAGIVSTLAGSPESIGSADGTGSAARFKYPSDLVADDGGNLYVADTENRLIRKVTPAGVVTTVAGMAGQEGNVDGQGSAARFRGPSGIALDASGALIVSDSFNYTIRKVTPGGMVTTFAGTGTFGSTDGTGTAAKFGYVRGLKLDAAGNIYVADDTAQLIRRITPQGVVTTLAGSSQQKGFVNGTGSAARFETPASLALDTSGNVYVADATNSAIRKLTPARVVTTLAGGPQVKGSANGTGGAARFNNPRGTAVDNDGNVYVADASNFVIRKITPAGVVTTLAGSPGASGVADGTGSAARFSDPRAVAVDAAGTVFVAERSHVIRKITAAGVVTTFAGQAGTSGTVDGTGTAARFYSPSGIAVDSAGYVYVTEFRCIIRKISPAGVVTTLAGSPGNSGHTDGTGSAARFSFPEGIAVDGAGNLYVGDTVADTVRKVTPAGVVTTFAGQANSQGSADGTGGAARFTEPNAIAVDGAGNVYVSDSAASTIRKITPGRVVTTIGGLYGSPLTGDGTGNNARFAELSGIASSPSGVLYVGDTDNHRIVRGEKAVPLATPQTLTVLEDTPQAVVMSGTDAGGNSLTYITVQLPAHGTLFGTGASRVYAPAANYNGPDFFTFKVNNGTVDSTVATVSITVTPVNDPPGAADQTLTVNEDTTLPLTLTGSDVDGDALSFHLITPPLHGTLTGTGASRIYTPAPDYNGPDTFTFAANDGTVDSAPAGVSLTVDAVNDAPVATPQTLTVNEDTVLMVTPSGTDVDGDLLHYEIVTNPSHGTISGNGLVFNYTPAQDYNGPDTFTFRATDGILESAPVTVTITVLPVNDPPVFPLPPPGVSAGPAAPPSFLDLSPYVHDPDTGDTRAWRLAATENPGIFESLAIDSAGVLSIRYAPYVSGVSSVTVEVMDSAGEKATVTFQVTLPELPLPEMTGVTPLLLNRQTGLWEQRITLKNIAERAIGGFEVSVSGLPPDATLYNASNALGVRPLAGYYQPVAPGESVTLVLEYYSASRSTSLAPVLSLALALPREPAVSAPGGLAVDMVKILPGNAVLIEFTALPSHLYTVQYSGDGTTWTDSMVRIRAAGNRVQWIDNGAPKTPTPPLPGGHRMYRVKETEAMRVTGGGIR